MHVSDLKSGSVYRAVFIGQCLSGSVYRAVFIGQCLSGDIIKNDKMGIGNSS